MSMVYTTDQIFVSLFFLTRQISDSEREKPPPASHQLSPLACRFFLKHPVSVGRAGTTSFARVVCNSFRRLAALPTIQFIAIF